MFDDKNACNAVPYIQSFKYPCVDDAKPCATKSVAVPLFVLLHPCAANKAVLYSCSCWAEGAS